jgi:hypothetical protein
MGEVDLSGSVVAGSSEHGNNMKDLRLSRR